MKELTEADEKTCVRGAVAWSPQMWACPPRPRRYAWGIRPPKWVPLPGRISPAYTRTYTRTCTRTRTCTYTYTRAHVAASDAQAEPEQRQSGDRIGGQRLADGACKEANGSHVPEVDINVEDAFDLPLHLGADEDEAAGGNVVVCGLDEKRVDKLEREDRVGSEFPEVGLGRGCIREGKRGGTAAGGEEAGEAGAVRICRWW